MKSFDESYESLGNFPNKDKEAFRTSKKLPKEEAKGVKRGNTKIYSLAELRCLQSTRFPDINNHQLSSRIYKFCNYDPFKKARDKSSTRKKKGKPTPHYAGINYGSISEAALGILLEELIPDFTVEEGKTYQLPLGGGRTVDFLINNSLVEFHYPRFFVRSNDLGDFASVKERRDFHKALKRVGRNKHQKNKLLQSTQEQLIRNYTLKRRKQIDMSLYGPHTELIVASSAQDFYWKVICRFVGVGAISETQFMERFNQCCKSVVKSSKLAWNKAA